MTGARTCGSCRHWTGIPANEKFRAGRLCKREAPRVAVGTPLGVFPLMLPSMSCSRWQAKPWPERLGRAWRRLIGEGMTHEQWAAQAKIGFVEFAWLPRQMKDGRWVWLRDYYWRLERTPRMDRGWSEAVNYLEWPIPDPVPGPPPSGRSGVPAKTVLPVIDDQPPPPPPPRK